MQTLSLRGPRDSSSVQTILQESRAKLKLEILEQLSIMDRNHHLTAMLFRQSP